MFAGLEFYPYGYLLLFLLGAVILLCGLFFKVRSDRKNESVVSHKDSADVPFKAVLKNGMDFRKNWQNGVRLLSVKLCHWRSGMKQLKYCGIEWILYGTIVSA